MRGRIRTWLGRGGVVGAILGALPLLAPAADVAHADATTNAAFYSMDEAPGSTVLVDSSGNGRHGTIGAEVVPGVQFDGATAHRFPWVPTAAPPAHPEHLNRVADRSGNDTAWLDPGTSDYAVTVRYRTTENFGNVVQKGQNGAAGGYFKIEIPQGNVTCLFRDSTGVQRAATSPQKVNDGQWHVIRCERLATGGVSVYIDGVRAARNNLTPRTGNVNNTVGLTIGGKGNCDQVQITCDYFVGDIDYVRIEKGSSGPANQPPTPGYTDSCTGLICSFTSTSTDADGAIQTWAWNFGDGGTGQGAAVNHTFPSAGSYNVSLTVTDDRGVSRTTARSITVAPVAEIISFVGQNTTSGNRQNHPATIPNATQPGDAILLFFADNNNAVIGQPTGVSGWTQLDSITGGYGTTRVWRKVAGPSDAGATVTVPLSKLAKGSVTVAVYRGTNQTDPVSAFARVADTSSTTQRTSPFATVGVAQSWGVSFWMHGDSASTSLTAPAGVTTRAGGTQTGGGRVTTLIADSNASLPTGPYGGLTATGAAASTTSAAWTIILAPASGPVPNQAPTAAFSPSCAEMTCSFDSSGSADGDGTIASYAWDFGDGATSTDANPSHLYSAPGTYTVTLTVTDDDNATSAAATADVTVPVTAPVDVITFVAAASSNANAVNHSVTIPASVQAGDGLLLFFSNNNGVGVTNPAGWTVLDTVTPGGTTQRVYRKVATASDAGATVTVSLSAISKAGLTVAAYRGTSATDPVAAFARLSFTSGSARTTPTVEVAGAQHWVVSYWSHKDSSTDALTPPAGVEVRVSGSQTSGGRVTTLVADSAGVVPSGAYGGLTATAAATSSVGSAWTIVLAPAT